MPEPDPPDDGRTPEERALDKALKNTFPASDPTGAGGGTASPRDAERQPSPSSGEDDEDAARD